VPGRSPSTITDLSAWIKKPGVGGVGAGKAPSTMSLAAGPNGDVWLFAGELLYFDGTTWKAQDPAPKRALASGHVAPDGALWAIDVVGGVHVLEQGAWHQEPLPNGQRARSLAVTKDGTVWVTTGTSLLRT